MNRLSFLTGTGELKLLRLISLDGPLLDSLPSTDHETDQQDGAGNQRDNDRQFGHVTSLSTNSALAQPLPGQAVPTLAAGAQRGSAAFFNSVTAGGADRAAASGSIPVSDAAAFDPGPCGSIDFDDEREFDFSRVKPRLVLVISNPSPVKA